MIYEETVFISTESVDFYCRAWICIRGS